MPAIFVLSLAADCGRSKMGRQLLSRCREAASARPPKGYASKSNAGDHKSCSAMAAASARAHDTDD